MIKGQKSIIGGIENFLCPFTDMYISQGSNGAYSHKGIMANDVRGKIAGIKYPYYAPCTCKCLKKYPKTGQVMWQSINKVRFANGRIDYATFMTAHDDSMNVKIGQVVSQGKQLGNMGKKGYSNMTGVHCHIQVSQSNDITWIKNKYGNYHFNKEYDLDECYFVDNTNILNRRGGNWKNTTQINIEELNEEKVDQILHIGSKVKFDGIFKVDVLRKPLKSNMFGNELLTGVNCSTYLSGKAKEYHWIPLEDWTEVDKYGNVNGQDQIIVSNKSYVLNKNIYEVIAIDVKSNSAKLNLNNHDIWIFSTFLYEVNSKKINKNGTSYVPFFDRKTENIVYKFK